MKPLRPIEYATGFLMGIFFGLFAEAGMILLYRLFSAWFGWAQLDLSWWMLIPVPLVSALGMGKAIAGLHLEDY